MFLRHWLRTQLKKIFMGKGKKKQLMFWQLFFIFHKNNVKTFLKWILNQYPKSTRKPDPKNNNKICYILFYFIIIFFWLMLYFISCHMLDTKFYSLLLLLFSKSQLAFLEPSTLDMYGQVVDVSISFFFFFWEGRVN